MTAESEGSGAPDARSADVPDPTTESRVGRRLLIAVVLGLVVYAALALWADVDGLGPALRAIPWWAPVAACALSFTNYLVRFPRWQRYLTISGSSVRGWTSLRIYLAGLALTVSPGKVGEAMKSWLLRETDGTPLATSAPIVLAERLTDLLGFLVLIALTSSAGDQDWIAIATLAIAVGILALVSSRRVAHAVVKVASGLPVVGHRALKIEETLDSARRLLAPRELPVATLLAAAGWFLECVGCWLIARSVLPADAVTGEALGLAAVTYAFALSAVAGAVVVIAPGGLGVTEGLLTKMLEGDYVAAGFAATAARSTAFSVTLVTRLCTLWFAMGVGLVALQIHRRLRASAGAPRP